METKMKEISLNKLQARLRNEEDLKYNFHSILHLNDNEIHLHNLVTENPKSKEASKKKDSKSKKRGQLGKKYSPIDKNGFITQFSSCSNVETKRFKQAVINNKLALLEAIEQQDNFGIKAKKESKGKRAKPLKSSPEQKPAKKVKTK